MLFDELSLISFDRLKFQYRIWNTRRILSMVLR